MFDFILTALSLILILFSAAVYGRMSVQLISEPERLILPATAPKPRSLKAAEARKRFRGDRLYRLVSAATVIYFPSTTVDWGVSTALAILFTGIVYREHGAGLVQYMLDTLLPGEGPALADWTAAMILVAVLGTVLVIVSGVIHDQQQKKAASLAAGLASLGEQPRFYQARSLEYYFQLRRFERGRGRGAHLWREQR